MSVREKFLEIISEYIDIPAEEINTEEGLKFSGGLDSFALLSLITSIENHFNISIPDSKIHEFKTINDIIGFIDENK